MTLCNARRSLLSPALGLLSAALLVGALSTPALAQPFDGCGTLVQGVECVLFQADVGGLYVVPTSGFLVGDEVRVVGTIDPFCITICQQGNGCIFGTTTLCDPPLEPEFTRGDINSDGAFDISDPVTLLAALFDPFADPLDCQAAADANDDETVDIGDAVYALAALFSGGATPPSPHPGCGIDPTAGPLTCEGATACP